MSIRKYLILSFIFMLGILQTGCGGSAYSSSEVGIQYDSGFTGVSYNAGYDMTNVAGISEYKQSNIETIDTQSEQKLIRTVSLDISLDTSEVLLTSVNDIKELVLKHKGYTTYSNVNTDSRYASGNLTVKVPKNNVDSFLNEVRESGYSVTNSIDNYEDVTMEYTDINSRLQVKIKARDRYEDILDKAETVEEIISVQSKLDAIQEEIESVQAKLNVMNNRIDYTEVSIYISCKTSVDKEGFFERAKTRLSDIFYDAGNMFIDMVEWLVNSVIFLIFAVPVAFVLIKIFLVAIGKKKFSLKNVFKRRNKSTTVELDDGKD